MADIILALGFDLFLKPKLAEAARALGVELRHVAPKDAPAAARDASRVIADASAPGVLDALRDVRAQAPALPIVACYPHVDAALGDALRALGATTLTRGAMVADLARAMS